MVGRRASVQINGAAVSGWVEVSAGAVTSGLCFEFCRAYRALKY